MCSFHIVFLSIFFQLYRLAGYNGLFVPSLNFFSSVPLWHFYFLVAETIFVGNGIISQNYQLCRIWNFFISLICVTVGTPCCGIHTTTKGLASMRKREMLIICVAFSLQQCSLRSFRLLDYTQFMLIRKFVLANLLICAYYCYIYGVQEKKLMHNLRKYDVPLHRYMAMMDLQVIVHLSNLHWFLKGYLFMENS